MSRLTALALTTTLSCFLPRSTPILSLSTMASTYTDIKGEVVITAQLSAKPGAGDELAKWADKLKAYVDANEPGTLEYTFARHGDTFAVWERYANADAVTAHLSSAIMKSFQSADVFAKPPALLFFSGNIHGE
ncbi:hypothetical protein AcV7_008689 [Taiwanofungus camphoratus]|nr:hypothetical protein AcV7_008689 [Antrodia cinnamomea]